MLPVTDPERTVSRVCFTCDVALLQADREGVEIDYCPECRSIWLDRGELEKLVDRLSLWFPETTQGYERPWDDDDDRIGPGSRVGGMFDLR